jgi:3-oxoacyl-[acyl-carrier protein] reductase
MKFSNNIALVTGASRGIGRAIALQLAEDGADVAVHYRASENLAREVCVEIEKLGRRAICTRADITNRDEVQSMVEQVTRELGPIDLLVNNAGELGDGGKTFDDLTGDVWDRTVAINLTGPFNVLWAVKGGMIERRRGSIVNISSISALAVRPNQLPYAAAKAGVISMTKCACGALAKHNIRINALAPGAIETDMLSEISPEARSTLEVATPLGRVGKPEEMANVVSFLLSDEASYITGATVIASGGRILMP